MIAESVFREAQKRSDPKERAAYLEEACAGDPELRRCVEILLTIDEEGHTELVLASSAPSGIDVESVMKSTTIVDAFAGSRSMDLPETISETGPGEAAPSDGRRAEPETVHCPEEAQLGSAPRMPRTEIPPESATLIPKPGEVFDFGPLSASMPVPLGPGARIGPYRILSELGKGGMGAVYLAEQEEPIRRRVALKLIRPGIAVEQFAGRFESERQALALMDHANIAKVLDAGSTQTGLPYFVMEYVQGPPITEYCDRHHLSPRARLELFIPVCRAIEHAHQKGIIHRDVKPSNVLVASEDGKPIAKVIDFGIAKAINPLAPERTMLTFSGAIIGTPEYMSPEQADGTGLDIDTRSDIYSLGVLLYELLIGSTPLDSTRLRQWSLDEILRKVREEEPPKPSTRLFASREELAAISERRNLDPARLKRVIRGELDWIVMKALEKDRARRYQSATGFARDIERYLQDEPVEACPPSATYRMKKFAKKNRGLLTTMTAFALLLILGATLSMVEAIRATQAEQRAVNANLMTEKALVEATKAHTQTQKALRDSEQDRRSAEAVSKYLVSAFRMPDPRQDGKALKVVDVLDQAVSKLDLDFRGSEAIKGDVLDALGQTYEGLGLTAKALKVGERAVALRKTALGPDDPDTLQSMHHLGMSYFTAGQMPESAKMLADAWHGREKTLGADHADTLESMTSLAMVYQFEGREEQALPLLEQAFRRSKEKYGLDNDGTLSLMSKLAYEYRAVGRLAEALPLIEENFQLVEAKRGREHPDTLVAMNILAMAYASAGRAQDAITLETEVLRLRRAKLGPEHPYTLHSMNHLGEAYIAAGSADKAIEILEVAVQLERERMGADHPDTTLAMSNLAAAYRLAGRADDALELQEQTLKLRMSKLGVDHRDTLASMKTLAAIYAQIGRRSDEMRLRGELLKALRAKIERKRSAAISAMSEMAAVYHSAHAADSALPLRREILEQETCLHGADSEEAADAGTLLGRCLVEAKRHAEAEPVLRHSVEVHRQKAPRNAPTYESEIALGLSLLGQKKYAEAEPVLTAGFRAMAARSEMLPPEKRAELHDYARKIVEMYEDWVKRDQAQAWRKVLLDLPPETKGPH